MGGVLRRNPSRARAGYQLHRECQEEKMTPAELRTKTRPLYAPSRYGTQPCRYHDAPDSLMAKFTGGCGPGGKGDALVPDTNWGLSIKPSCSIHDWMYKWGQTQGDKELADIIFLENMLRQVESASMWFKIPRRYRAVTYYGFVKDFGKKAFWKGKEAP